MQWDPVGPNSASTISSNSREMVASEENASLNIQPLAELIEMFHSRDATNPRDKIYALLGLSTDPSLLAVDYKIRWCDLLQNLIYKIFGPLVTVATWPKTEGKPEVEHQAAVIGAHVCILGRISRIGFFDDRADKQEIEVRSDHFRNSGGSGGSESWSAIWLMQRTAISVEPGDILCLVKGATLPTIVRPYKDYCVIIAITTSPPKNFQVTERLQRVLAAVMRSGADEWTAFLSFIQSFHLKILMLWNWRSTVTLRDSIEETINHSKLPTKLTFESKEWHGFDTELGRLINMARIFDLLKDEESIREILEYTYERKLYDASTYIEKLGVAYRHWEAYMEIRRSLERLWWAIWYINGYDVAHSDERIFRLYCDIGNIPLDLCDILALSQPLGEKELQLEMFYKPHILDTSSDLVQPSYDHIERLLDVLFPEYARLPHWNDLGTKYYWQSRFLRKVILHSKGDGLRVTDQVISAAAINKGNGIFIIDLLAEYGNIYPSVNMVPYTCHVLLDHGPYNIITKLSYRFELLLHLLRNRDVIVQEYFILEALVESLMAQLRRRGGYYWIFSDDDVQFNRDGLLSLIAETNFCEICILQDGGKLLNDLYVVLDIPESDMTMNVIDAMEHSKLTFERYVNGREIISHAEAAKHLLKLCMTERWGFDSAVPERSANILDSDSDFWPLISVERIFFEAVDDRVTPPYPVDF
jgi:hypothetical protein